MAGWGQPGGPPPLPPQPPPPPRPFFLSTARFPGAPGVAAHTAQRPGQHLQHPHGGGASGGGGSGGGSGGGGGGGREWQQQQRQRQTGATTTVLPQAYRSNAPPGYTGGGGGAAQPAPPAAQPNASNQKVLKKRCMVWLLEANLSSQGMLDVVVAKTALPSTKSPHFCCNEAGRLTRVPFLAQR